MSALLRSSNPDKILCWACASGKTLLLQMYIQRVLGAIYDHIIVVSPTDIIRHAWETRHASSEDREILVGDIRIRLDEGLVRGPGWSSKHEVLTEYLRQPTPGYALSVCASTALSALESATSMERVLVVFDETHHRPSRVLGAVDHLIRTRGAHTVGITATPFRMDRREVVRRGAELFERTMQDQMEGGYAPSVFEHHYEPILLPVGLAVNVDELIEHITDTLVQRIVADRDSQGRLPKFFVQIPAQQRNEDREDADDLDESYAYRILGMFQRKMLDWVQQHGKAYEKSKRILDVSDRQASDVRREVVLSTERRILGYAQSELLGIIGSARLDEGLDWKLASHVYRFGISQSTAKTIQFVGRGQRNKTKIKGYPKTFRNLTKATFLVPCRADTPMDHAEAILKLCLVFGSTMECGSSLLSRLLHKPPSSSSGVEPRNMRPENTTPNMPAEIAQDRLRQGILRVVTLIDQGSLEATSTDIRSFLENELLLPNGEGGRTPMSPVEANRVLGLAYESANPNFGARYRELLSERESLAVVDPEIRSPIRESVDYERLQESVLAQLIEECRNEKVTFERVAGMRQVRRELSRWTAQEIGEWNSRYINRTRSHLNPQDVYRWALAHREATSYWPGPGSQEVPHPGESWSNISAALRSGRRGLPKHIDIMEFLAHMECGGDPVAALERFYQVHQNNSNRDEVLDALEANPALVLYWDRYKMARRVGATPDIVKAVGLQVSCARFPVLSRYVSHPRFKAFWRSLRLALKAGPVTNQDLVRLMRCFRDPAQLAA